KIREQESQNWQLETGNWKLKTLGHTLLVHHGTAAGRLHRQLPERGDLSMAAGAVGSPAGAVVLSIVRTADRLVRQSARDQLSDAAGPVPAVRPAHLAAIPPRRSG